MSLSTWFGWNVTTETTELPEIFPVPIAQGEFVSTDIVTIYSKILTDCLERTNGLTDEELALMWDNCVKGNAPDGLVTMLAKAMSDKQDIFLVYEKALKVIRPATGPEQSEIRTDYEKIGESKKGIFISFQNYKRSDMVKLYLGMEYCTVSSLFKSMNLSKAIQFKMSDMRASVNLIDKDAVKTQAQSIATALAAGRAVLIDGKDSIETTTPDLTAVNSSIEFLENKLSFYLGLPAAYISGEQTGGLGTTGENDTKATERGLKSYFFSILKPTLETLFSKSVTYKSQDFRQIAGSMEVIKTFALVDEALISGDNKRKIINGMLDLPEDAKGDPAKKLELPAPAVKIPPVAEAQ